MFGVANLEYELNSGLSESSFKPRKNHAAIQQRPIFQLPSFEVTTSWRSRVVRAWAITSTESLLLRRMSESNRYP